MLACSGTSEILYNIDGSSQQFSVPVPGASNVGEKVFTVSPIEGEIQDIFTILYYDNDDIYEAYITPDSDGNYSTAPQFQHTDSTKAVNIEDWYGSLTHTRVRFDDDEDDGLTMPEPRTAFLASDSTSL